MWYVDNRIQIGIFTQDDLELLGAIAASAAIAIENARLYQDAVEKGRMERELQMAYRVQSSLIPEYTPELAGWEFATHWQPANEVAGDYYGFGQNIFNDMREEKYMPKQIGLLSRLNYIKMRAMILQEKILNKAMAVKAILKGA